MIREGLTLNRREFLVTTGIGGLGLVGCTNEKKQEAVTSEIRVAMQQPAGPLVIAAPTMSDWKVLTQRAALLQLQLDRNLSYVGQPRNYVTRISPYTIEGQVDSLVRYAELLQSRTDTLDSILENAQTRHDELQKSAEAAAKAASDLQTSLEKMISDWNSDESQLAVLTDSVNQASQGLQLAERTFNQVVVDATAKNCSFVDIVSAIKSVVAIYEGGVGAYGAFGDALHQVDVGGLGINNLKVIAQQLQPVGGDITSIVAGYQAIKSTVGTDGTGSLIVINGADLDRHVDDVKQAIDAVSAASSSAKYAFKAAITDYVGAVQARNQKVLQMDQLTAQAMSTASTIVTLQAQFAKLTASANAALKPDVAETALSLRTIKKAYFAAVRNVIWGSNRSLDYYLLRPYAPDPNLRIDDIGQLAASAGGTQATLTAALASWSGSAERFPQSGQPAFRIRFMLKALDRAALKRDRKVTCRLSLTDRPSQYARAYRVYADSVKVAIDGAAEMSGYLTHMGTSRFAVDQSSTIEFILPTTTHEDCRSRRASW